MDPPRPPVARFACGHPVRRLFRPRLRFTATPPSAAWSGSLHYRPSGHAAGLKSAKKMLAQGMEAGLIAAMTDLPLAEIEDLRGGKAEAH